MTDTERLQNTVTRFQLLVNSLAFVMTDKTVGIENDALAFQVKTAIKDLIKKEILRESAHESITNS